MPGLSSIFGGGKEKVYSCRIFLLDDSQLAQDITSKTRGYELLQSVFTHLNLFERDYFGLRYRDFDDTNHWLDPEKSIRKQVHATPPYDFFFGVKFYAGDPTKLTEELTKYQFFLQIKKDMLQGRLPCTFNVAAELCAFAVQSELGDYEPALHTEGYVSEFRFIPSQTEVLEKKIAEIHPKLRGQVPSEAETNFLERVKWLEMYGVDLHPVRGQDGVEYFLGLTPTGLVLFKSRNKIGSFIWPKITKLKFKGNNFILRANQGKFDEEKEYVFSVGSKEAAKNLWKCCAEHHTFFRLEKANDVAASAYNFLFKKGSGFRFSGRTQQEILEESERRRRPQPVVQRTQSKRYVRRNSAESYAQSERSVSSRVNHQRSMDGSVVKTQGETGTPYSVNGDGNARPWEQTPTGHGGLYTTGSNMTKTVMQEELAMKKTTSPRFPRCQNLNCIVASTHHGRQGKTSVVAYTPEATNDLPKRKVSQFHGYQSGDDSAARRKRSHYYSGYTSASDAESIVRMHRNTRGGSEPNVNYRSGNQRQDLGFRYDDFLMHRHQSRESVSTAAYEPPSDYEYRYQAPRTSGSKSDSEQATRQRRHHHYHHHHRQRGGQSDTEMVSAMGPYHSPSGVAHVSDGGHRRHRHHHHQHRPRKLQYGYDPGSAKVLLELGPESATSNPPQSTSPPNQDQPPPDSTRSPYQQSNTSFNSYASYQGIMQNNTGYQYVEHGPRTNSSLQHPLHKLQDQRNNKQGMNRYLQQYLPSHLLQQGTEEAVQASNRNSRQFVEQVVGPGSATPRHHPQNIRADYSISTEL